METVNIQELIQRRNKKNIIIYEEEFKKINKEISIDKAKGMIVTGKEKRVRLLRRTYWNRLNIFTTFQQ